MLYLYSGPSAEDLWSIWSHQECINVPELGERRDMLEWHLSDECLQKHQILTLAQRTAGFVFGDLQALLSAAQRSEDITFFFSLGPSLFLQVI